MVSVSVTSTGLHGVAASADFAHAKAERVAGTQVLAPAEDVGLYAIELVSLCARYAQTPLDPDLALALFSLESVATEPVSELSVSQRWLVAIACAVVTSPEHLVIRLTNELCVDEAEEFQAFLEAYAPKVRVTLVGPKPLLDRYGASVVPGPSAVESSDEQPKRSGPRLQDVHAVALAAFKRDKRLVGAAFGYPLVLAFIPDRKTTEDQNALHLPTAHASSATCIEDLGIATVVDDSSHEPQLHTAAGGRVALLEAQMASEQCDVDATLVLSPTAPVTTVWPVLALVFSIASLALLRHARWLVSGPYRLMERLSRTTPFVFLDAIYTIGASALLGALAYELLSLGSPNTPLISVALVCAAASAATIFPCMLLNLASPRYAERIVPIWIGTQVIVGMFFTPVLAHTLGDLVVYLTPTGLAGEVLVAQLSGAPLPWVAVGVWGAITCFAIVLYPIVQTGVPKLRAAFKHCLSLPDAMVRARISARIPEIDIVRGVVLTAMLIINLYHLAGPYALFEPLAYSVHSTDNAVELLCRTLLESAGNPIFSMWFGLGFAIQLNRGGDAAVPRFVSRLLLLLMIGIAHRLLLWDGDILARYALAGLLLVRFRHRAPRQILRTGVAILAGYFALATLLLIAAFAGQGLETSTTAALLEAVDVYRHSGFTALVALRWEGAVAMALAELPQFLWTFSFFLVGLWVEKRGILEHWRDQRRLYRLLIATMLPVAIVAKGAWAWMTLVSPAWSVSFGQLSMFVGAAALALVYLSLLLLGLAGAGASTHRRITSFFSPLGRMVLTNYLMQSAIGVFVFSGAGLGLYGQLPLFQLMLGYVPAVLLFQVGFSKLWLRHFPAGPVEWTWRTVADAFVRRIPRAHRVEPKKTRPV